MPRPLLIAAVTLVALLAIAPAARGAGAPWGWPVSGDVIAPYRNGDDPYAAGQHRGIDIAAPVGTPVMAAAAGEVRFAGTAGSSGLTVSIRTADGRFDTSYLHLSSVSVHAGDHVSRGDRIGAVGTTGKRSTAAPHLHFGVRDAGSRHGYRDPLDFLPAPTPSERPRPAPAPAPGPAPSPRPEPAPGPRALPARRALRHPRALPVPATGPAPVPAPTPALRHPRGHRQPRAFPMPRALPRPRTVPQPQGAAGPDLGYALACIGLLLAAAILGLTEDGRRTTRRSRTRLEGLLRPAMGRRS